MVTIGSKVKNVRISLGLTVEFLATEIGVSRSYLTLIENGERRLPKRLVGKLAKTLGLSKGTVYEWYLEQELREVGITDKKSYELMKSMLRMTSKEKESLLKVFKDGKIGFTRARK